MVAFVHHRRQEPGLSVAPIEGVSNIQTSATGRLTASTALLGDTGATGTISIAPSSTLAPSTHSETPLATPTSPPQASGGDTISIGTVVGACIGALVGATALILIAFIFYRRYNRKLTQKPQRRAHPPYSGDESGARSKSWNRLEDAEDRWEGKEKVPVIGPPPAGKQAEKDAMLSPSHDMFQKSPSVSSHTEEAATVIKHPYNNPSANGSRVPETRDLIGREPQNLLGSIDSGPPIAWASATRLEGGAVSPSLVVAIPTPPAVRSQAHHWESAEVLNYSDEVGAQTSAAIQRSASPANTGDGDYIKHPYKDASGGNPFFGGRNDVNVTRSRSASKTSISGRSRASSAATIQQTNVVAAAETPKENASSKERVVSIDPFKDPLPQPQFIQHAPTASASSSASNERAIRQLISAAGMDGLTEEEVQRRLKAVSMQPSVMSDGDSMYTDADPDMDPEAMKNFPIPPSSVGHP